MQEFSPADWGFALAVMLFVLTMLIAEKGLVTSGRFNEMRQYAERERLRAERAEAAFRENTRQLERLADLLEIGKDLRHVSGD